MAGTTTKELFDALGKATAALLLLSEELGRTIDTPIAQMGDDGRLRLEELHRAWTKANVAAYEMYFPDATEPKPGPGLVGVRPTPNLIDCAQQHRVHGATFAVPSVEALNRIAVDALVKVGVTFEAAPEDQITGERFWVKVAVMEPGAGIVGIIDNDLEYPHRHGLRCGQKIFFETRHVLELEEPES